MVIKELQYKVDSWKEYCIKWKILVCLEDANNNLSGKKKNQHIIGPSDKVKKELNGEQILNTLV